MTLLVETNQTTLIEPMAVYNQIYGAARSPSTINSRVTTGRICFGASNGRLWVHHNNQANGGTPLRRKAVFHLGSIAQCRLLSSVCGESIRLAVESGFLGKQSFTISTVEHPIKRTFANLAAF